MPVSTTAKAGKTRCELPYFAICVCGARVRKQPVQGLRAVFKPDDLGSKQMQNSHGQDPPGEGSLCGRGSKGCGEGASEETGGGWQDGNIVWVLGFFLAFCFIVLEKQFCLAKRSEESGKLLF